jgi:Protein of unknown function, DUF481
MSSMLLIGILLAQATSATPAPATPPPPDVVWSGTVGLGLISLTGNSQTLTLAFTTNVQRKSKDWIWALKAGGAYASSQAPDTGVSTVSALNGAAQLRGDRRISDPFSIYLLAGIETDHLASIESRPYGELGAAYTWFDVKEGDLQKTSLRTDLGFRYGREFRFQYYPTVEGPSQNPDLEAVAIVAPTVGVAFRYALNKNVIFTEDLSFVANVADQARLLFTSTSKLTSRLTEKVSFGVTFLIRDDTQPVPPKVPTDTALTVGLEVGI